MSAQQQYSQVECRGQEQLSHDPKASKKRHSLARLILAGVVAASLLGFLGTFPPQAAEIQPSPIEDVTTLPTLAGGHQGGGTG